MADHDQRYQGNGKHDWETVLNVKDNYVDRLRVPGGWLYRDQFDLAGGTRVSIVMVPMPEVVKHKV